MSEHELQERILHLEKTIRRLERAKAGVQSWPGLNRLGQDTEVNGTLAMVERVDFPTGEADRLKLANFQNTPVAIDENNIKYPLIRLTDPFQHIISHGARFMLHGIGYNPTLGHLWPDISGCGNSFDCNSGGGYQWHNSTILDPTSMYPISFSGPSAADGYAFNSNAANLNMNVWCTVATWINLLATGKQELLGTLGHTTPSWRWTIETDNKVKLVIYTTTGQTLTLTSSNTVSAGINFIWFRWRYVSSSDYDIQIGLNGATTTYSSTAPTGQGRAPVGDYRIFYDGSFTPTYANMRFAIYMAGDRNISVDMLDELYKRTKPFFGF